MEQTNALKNKIEELLKTIPDYVAESGELKYNLVKEDAQTGAVRLLEPLLQNEALKAKFFTRVLDSFVFDTHTFCEVLEYGSGCNSYSKYLGKHIGLYFGDKALSDCSDVVLNFPFKDCVLEGGQTKEAGTETFYDKTDLSEKTAKRREVFYNEILAQDELDTLFAPKAFCNAKRYEANGIGEQSVNLQRNAEINRHRNLPDDTITDNLILKGNNLLALHSLEKEFAGKVKLIYIDPPYNTGNDSFAYNDNFNHSSWLTFMKNRLEVAKRLLRDDGCIFVQCDHHELGYMNLLLDETFGIKNKAQIITIKTSAPSGFKAVNPGPIDITEYILFYTKNKTNFQFRLGYTEAKYNKNYNLFLKRNPEKPNDTEQWEFYPIREIVLKENGFNNETEARALFRDFYKNVLEAMIAEFAFTNAENIVSVRDLHKPTAEMKQLQLLSKKNRNVIYTHVGQKGKITYFYKGGPLAFYSTKIKVLNGERTVVELLTNLWTHISWAGIAKEGSITLKNGKKPELLLKTILEVYTNPHDIVLDYHLGSGTTAAVAHKMGRQYIGIEQLDYGENDSVVRLKNVINGDKSGISKSVDWQGGGSFIYAEFAEKNERAIAEISACNSYEELIALFDNLCGKYFLHYNVHIKEFREEITCGEQFRTLTLEKQKEMFVRMLDLNQLYINATDRHDSSSGLTAEDIAFTEAFYREKEVSS